MQQVSDLYCECEELQYVHVNLPLDKDRHGHVRSWHNFLNKLKIKNNISEIWWRRQALGFAQPDSDGQNVIVTISYIVLNAPHCTYLCVLSFYNKLIHYVVDF